MKILKKLKNERDEEESVFQIMFLPLSKTK